MEIRCFISIEMPVPIKKSIGDVMAKLRSAESDVKWVSAENIHLTLKFLGQTDQSLITPLKEALHKKLSPYDPFYIKITGVGCFPHPRRPRVIWVGIEESEILRKLWTDIESEMVHFGFPEEQRRFSPHLTIGRVRSMRRIPIMMRTLDEYRTVDLGKTVVQKVSIMKSELKPAGAEYFTLAEIPFGRRDNVE